MLCKISKQSITSRCEMKYNIVMSFAYDTSDAEETCRCIASVDFATGNLIGIQTM